MKIRIEKNGSRAFTIRLPVLWLIGRVGAVFIRIVYGVRIKGRNLVRLRRIIKRYRRDVPDWTVVDVKSADGKKVNIRF